MSSSSSSQARLLVSRTNDGYSRFVTYFLKPTEAPADVATLLVWQQRIEAATRASPAIHLDRSALPPNGGPAGLVTPLLDTERNYRWPITAVSAQSANVCREMVRLRSEGKLSLAVGLLEEKGAMDDGKRYLVLDNNMVVRSSMATPATGAADEDLFGNVMCAEPTFVTAALRTFGAAKGRASALLAAPFSGPGACWLLAAVVFATAAILVLLYGQ
jgi:hypothetical protein